MIASFIPLLAVEPTPDTSGYMIAAYIVIFGVMLGYLISLIVRTRSLRQDLDTLEELEASSSSISPAKPKGKLPGPAAGSHDRGSGS